MQERRLCSQGKQRLIKKLKSLKISIESHKTCSFTTYLIYSCKEFFFNPCLWLNTHFPYSKMFSYTTYNSIHEVLLTFISDFTNYFLPIPHVLDWFFITCNLDYTFYKVWKKEMYCFYNAKVPGKIHLPLSESNSFDHSKSTFIDRLAFNTVINWSTFWALMSICCCYISKDIQGYSDALASLNC